VGSLRAIISLSNKFDHVDFSDGSHSFCLPPPSHCLPTAKAAIGKILDTACNPWTLRTASDAQPGEGRRHSASRQPPSEEQRPSHHRQVSPAHGSRIYLPASTPSPFPSSPLGNKHLPSNSDINNVRQSTVLIVLAFKVSQVTCWENGRRLGTRWYRRSSSCRRIL
jgi:hypothetical protein